MPVPFSYDGRQSLRRLYGPTGPAEIVTTAVRACGAGRASLTLKIHQAEGRLPLGDAAGLFRRWRDTTNTKRMNYWLAVLADKNLLVRAALGLPPPLTMASHTDQDIRAGIAGQPGFRAMNLM